VEGGAYLLGDGVGKRLTIDHSCVPLVASALWASGTLTIVYEVANGADGHLLCCGEHVGGRGLVAGQDAVDVEHHHL